MFLASLGGFLEFYDFTIFGFYAVYFAEEIFPDHNRLSSLIDAYIIFALSFLIKPLGMIIFRHFSHQISAKSTLIITVIIMGICSLLMGVIPPFSSIGVAAGWLMMAFRLIQGMASGGEIYGIIRYINEYIPEEKTHHTISSLLLGAEFGGLFAIVINQVLNHHMLHSQIQIWGWRIPFIIGGIFSFSCYSFRHLFNRKPMPIKQRYKFDLVNTIQKYMPEIMVEASVIGMGSALWVNCIIYMPIMLYYQSQLSYYLISNIMLEASFISLAGSFMMGIVAWRVNPVTLLKITLITAIPTICLSYYLFSINSYIYIAVDILVTLHGIFARLLPMALMNKLFPTKERLGGVYLTINLSYTLFGVFSPLIILYIIYLTDSPFAVQASYLSLVSIFGLIGVCCLNKFRADS